MTRTVKPIPDGYTTCTPALIFEDAIKALDWYKKALGAKEQSVSKSPEGKVMHADILIGNSHLMLHDEMMGTRSAKKLGGSPIELWLYVEDCDAVFKKAVDAGAKATFPPTDQFWGDRHGSFTDPFGLSWSVATHKEDLTKAEMERRQEAFFAEMAEKVS